jgi:serine protease Do
MESTSMSMKGGIRTGAAIATALFAAGNLAGQRPAAPPTRSRDSIVVRVFGPGLASMDSMRVLMQEFDREQAGTQRWLVLKERIDSLFGAPGAIVSANAFMRGIFAGAEANRLMAEDRRGWLGFNAQGPNLRALVNGELYITQLAHPVIVSVDPHSPADRAGIAAGDVLVAYNGVDVVNHELNVTALLKPEAKVTVTIRRDGETKDFPLVVAKAPRRISDLRIALENVPATGGFGPMDAPEGMRRIPAGATGLPREGAPLGGTTMSKAPILMIASNGVFGASMSTVNAELAKRLNLQAGVLVNDVPEDSPAWRAGLRIGDIITAVQDQPVLSVAELREVLVRARARAVALQVGSRNQKTRTVTVSLAPSP